MKIGYDNNGDDDIADAGDDIQVDDSFGSNVLSLSYDNNGNLTDDAVYKYEYDAWNRLVETKRRVDAETSVATYAYLGNNRRAKKVVQNCGTEHLAGDGGNTTVEYYYDRQWRIVETRNGSNQATAQYVWGTQYTDEIIFVDINGSPVSDNDCNPDQGIEAQTDSRYFYHQDRNWNVVAISLYDTNGNNNGRLVERYSYTPYGQFVVLTGDSGSGELGNLTPTSTIGNPFAHQGLPIDNEKASYQNRYREYASGLHRFTQRDPLLWVARATSGFQDGMNVYGYVGQLPLLIGDPCGQRRCEPGGWGNCGLLCAGDPDSLGWTWCDGRSAEPCTCVCPVNIVENLPGNDSCTYGLLNDCVQDHEDAHADCLECVPPWRSGRPVNTGTCVPPGTTTECRADIATMDCLGDAMDECENCPNHCKCLLALKNLLKNTVHCPSDCPQVDRETCLENKRTRLQQLMTASYIVCCGYQI